MAKEFDIFSRQQFSEVVEQFYNYFKLREDKGLPFQKIKLISKRWQKPKTSAQHRTYFRAIGELKKAFKDQGMVVNEEELHQFIKKRAGFTKTIHGTLITKSIADASEDATNENLRFLIDYIIQFSQEELNYTISLDPHE